jgi:hypothetical protein
MKTFLQLLRIAFWMLPLQRALTVVGTLVLLVGQFLRPSINAPGSTMPLMIFGVQLMMVVPLLGGGVFLRMLSASRALLLRPHARGRLLSGLLAILLLVAFSWILSEVLAFQSVPAKYRPDFEYYLLMFAMALSFGTLCTVTLFVASRSPLWTLLILVAWQVPGLLLNAFGVVNAAELLGGPVSIATSAVVWLAFGTWFLCARRVQGSGWARREGAAAEAQSEAPLATIPREQAMTRWLLGGATPLRIGANCLVAALGVLAVQWFFARNGDSGPLHAMMFGTLSLITAVGGAVSRGMTGHARSLWLPTGKTRLALHAWAERQMLLVVAAIFAAVALACLMVWWLLPERPALPVTYLIAAVLAPGLAAAWLGLMQQQRAGLLDALAGIAIFIGWAKGLVEPLYLGSADARWELLFAQLGLAVLLREIAYVRWRSADWRRVQRA